MTGIAIEMEVSNFPRDIVSKPQHKRLLLFGLVVVFHFIALNELGKANFLRPGPARLSDVSVFLTSPRAIKSLPPPTPPEVPYRILTSDPIAEPQIDIENDNPPATPAGFSGSFRVLPPRPDPSHVNFPPDLPKSLANRNNTSPVTLRLLILADGTIGEARVAASCGSPDLDKMAAEFVKANWRYAPARSGGKPADDWMTVLVRFRST
jgi:TonB family protein